MRDTLQKAKDLLYTEMNYTEKISSALALCSSQANRSLNEYFSDTALKDTAFRKLLDGNISEMKKDIYREYIELGKQEGIIDTSVSTELILRFIDLLGKMDFNKETLDIDLQGIHHLFLYGLIGR